MKACLPENSVLLWFDEKAKIAVKEYGGSVWTSAKHVFVAAKQKVKGLVELLAARNDRTGKIHYAFFDWKNAFIVIEFFEELLREYAGMTLYVVLDNWSAHKAGVLKALTDLNPRLQLAYLPTNASWMNEIERDFSHIERDVLRNSSFESVTEVMDAVSGYIENELTITNKCS